jgi:hypothetical protein
LALVFDDLDLGARRHRLELDDESLIALFRPDGGEAGPRQVERGGAALLTLLLPDGGRPVPPEKVSTFQPSADERGRRSRGERCRIAATGGN